MCWLELGVLWCREQVTEKIVGWGGAEQCAAVCSGVEQWSIKSRTAAAIGSSSSDKGRVVDVERVVMLW